ncbi:MAG: hypothetical protein NT009_03965 [Proteobacteria bacterium]|nr:hypothetical protein [Pseudomonadota bacterium]
MKLYNADDLKFLLTLRGICFALRWGRVLNPEVKKMAKENDLIVQFKAEREDIGRYYILRGGKLESRKGIHPNPEFSWVFSDAKAGFDILKAGSEEAVAQGMMEQKVRFEGDMNRGLWFNNVVKAAGDTMKKPGKIFKKKPAGE